MKSEGRRGKIGKTFVFVILCAALAVVTVSFGCASATNTRYVDASGDASGRGYGVQPHCFKVGFNPEGGWMR